MIKLLALDDDWPMLDYSAHKPAFSQDLLDYLTRFIAAGGIAGIVSGRTEESLRHEASANGWDWEAPFPSFCVLQEAYAKVPQDALAELNLQNRRKIDALSRQLSHFVDPWLTIFAERGLPPQTWSLSSSYPLAFEFSSPAEASKAWPVLEQCLASAHLDACRIHRNCHILALYHPACCKGSLLKAVAEHYGIAPGEVLAIGDSLNDATMLDGEYGFYCGAPENADPLIRSLVLSRGGKLGKGTAYTGVLDIYRQYRDEHLLPF